MTSERLTDDIAAMRTLLENERAAHKVACEMRDEIGAEVARLRERIALMEAELRIAHRLPAEIKRQFDAIKEFRK